MNRRTLPRLIAFLGILISGFYFIGIDVLNYRIGAQPFTVTALMPTASGLYPGAGVSYRGTSVGQVTSLDLSPTGVAVKLGIDPGTRIPDNGLAKVKQLSALGEQYLDLQPDRAGGPYLRAGSVIPASRIVLPTPIGTALVDLSTLLKSLNGNDLQTFESWLASAFIGTGQGLRQIITTGQELFDSLAAAQPETVNLIVDGNTDLHTLHATSNDFQTFSQGLAQFTAQLKNSNTDLQALINNSSAAANTVGPFLAANNQAIAGLIQNFSTDAQAAFVYQPAVQAFFQILPIVANRAAGALSGGMAHGEASFNVGQPVCAYVPAAMIHGPTQPTSSAELDNGCTTTNGEMLQRGANNSPGG
jgi:phospholipid/cholesterol/gamma-HCH transport system substrate-binding protein